MRGKRVLEIGTASGLLSIHTIKNCHATEVIATEIDDTAYQDATKNFKAHDVHRRVRLIKEAEIDARHGTFDYILLNIVMAEMADAEDDFSDMVSESLIVHDALFRNLPQILNPGGAICLAYASYGDIVGLSRLIHQYNLHITYLQKEEKFGVYWYYLELTL